MAKLHELIAANGTAKAQADKCRADLLNTFDKKRHHFGQKLVTFTPSEGDGGTVTEEQSDLVTTVRQELAWLACIWTKALDLSHQVNEANTRGIADVVLDDGTVLLKGVQGTSLLELEKRVSEMHALVSAIPTLDPAKGFSPDEQRGTDIHKSREVTKTRTRKAQRPLVLYPATTEHPAQTQLITEDIPVGTIREVEWSGLLTVAQKGDMLERVENLKRAVLTARCRANEVEAKDTAVGATLLGYVLTGKK